MGYWQPTSVTLFYAVPTVGAVLGTGMPLSLVQVNYTFKMTFDLLRSYTEMFTLAAKYLSFHLKAHLFPQKPV